MPAGQADRSEASDVIASFGSTIFCQQRAGQREERAPLGAGCVVDNITLARIDDELHLSFLRSRGLTILADAIITCVFLSYTT